jgi:hypothetical protein
MKQLSRLDPSDIVGVNCNKCDRRTATIDKFDFVCDAALVNVDNGTDVTAIQFLVFGLSIEHDEGVFFYHSSSSGKAVTNRGGSLGSTIQTVKT